MCLYVNFFHLLYLVIDKISERLPQGVSKGLVFISLFYVFVEDSSKVLHGCWGRTSCGINKKKTKEETLQLGYEEKFLELDFIFIQILLGDRWLCLGFRNDTSFDRHPMSCLAVTFTTQQINSKSLLPV